MEQILVDIESLKKEQSQLSNSINILKSEEGKLQIELKDLIEISSIKKNDLKSINNEIDNFKIEFEDKAFKINKQNKKLDELNSKIYSVNKILNETELNYVKIQENYSSKVSEIDIELKKLKENSEKVKLLIDEDLRKFKDDREIKTIEINNSYTLFLNQKNKLEKINIELSDKISSNNNIIFTLLSEEKKLNETIKQNQQDICKLSSEKNNLNINILQLNDEIDILKDEIVKNKKNIENQNKELDISIKKANFINKKEDHLKGFEAYLIEQSNRLGINYQPYE